MTGPEHYLEAERLITLARVARPDDLYGAYVETQSGGRPSKPERGNG
jgi:hypothetical protein